MRAYVGAAKDVSIVGPQEGKGPATDVLERGHFIPVIGPSGEKVPSQLLMCGFYPVVIASNNSHHGALAGTGVGMVRAGILQRRETILLFDTFCSDST